MLAQGKIVKVALIRDAGYPIGHPAPLHAHCICTNIIYNLDYAKDFKCSLCGQEYTGNGWLKERIK